MRISLKKLKNSGYRFALVALIGFVTLYLLTLSFSSKTTLTPNITRNVYLGFWTQKFWDDTTQKINPLKLKTVETEIGKKVAIANYFRGWEALENPKIVDELNTISDNGWVPMLSTNPYIFADCPSENKTLYGTIAAGDCDAFLHKAAQNLKSYGKPLFLRFAWEMNVNTMPWGIHYSGSSTGEFISAWKRFHDIAKEEKATNIRWVFSPQVETPTTTPISELYPGDQYVDWLGLDGYNWGTTQSWSKWESFYSIFADSYNKLIKISPNKPLIIAEVNTTNVGGDKSSWYKDMLSYQIPEKFPKVNAIVFFNEDKTSSENVNWLIDATPESLKSFKTYINNPIYRSDLSL